VAAPRPSPPPTPQEPRWRPWAVAAALLAAGGLVGWLATSALLQAVLPTGGPSTQAATPAPARPGEGPERAAVGPPTASGPGIPGQTVTLTWLVDNTGESIWSSDLYRYEPEAEGLPVVSLRAPRVGPGQTVTAQATATVPTVLGTWEPAWHLTGPQGKVPGGRLTATVTVQVDTTEP